MRYIKAFVFLCVFFVVLVFLFQNQAALSKTLTFQLNLLFVPEMTSIELPFYYVLLAAFLMGAVLCLLVLLYDRFRLSLAMARADMRIQDLEKEEKKMMAQMEKLACVPSESKKLFSFKLLPSLPSLPALPSLPSLPSLSSLSPSSWMSSLTDRFKSRKKEEAEAAEEASEAEQAPSEERKAEINEFFRETSADDFENSQATTPLTKEEEEKKPA